MAAMSLYPSLSASPPPPAHPTQECLLTNPLGHFWHDKWTAMSGPLSHLSLHCARLERAASHIMASKVDSSCRGGVRGLINCQNEFQFSNAWIVPTWCGSELITCIQEKSVTSVERTHLQPVRKSSDGQISEGTGCCYVAIISDPRPYRVTSLIRNSPPP